MRTRKSNRLKPFNYSNAGWYYVTICTKSRKHHFGKIQEDKMNLNQTGKIADEYWNKIEILHKNVELDYYVIMPNHIHGIIINNYNVVDANLASTTTIASTTDDRTKMELSKLIQQFKRAVTLKIKSINPDSTFKWQRSFYDRIIRNERELYNIRKYIQLNPFKWSLEKDITNLDI